MITRFINYLTRENRAWESYFDVLAGLPANF